MRHTHIILKELAQLKKELDTVYETKLKEKSIQRGSVAVNVINTAMTRSDYE